MPLITSTFTHFLDSANSIVADSFIYFESEGNILFAGVAETYCECYTVFHCLTCTLHLYVRWVGYSEGVRWWEGRDERRLRGERFFLLWKSRMAMDLDKLT